MLRSSPIAAKADGSTTQLNRDTLDEIESLLGSLKRTERTAARSINAAN